MGNPEYLNVVFLLCLLPQFGLTSNRTWEARCQEKKPSDTVGELQSMVFQ
jgi:hypothetical protein